MFGGPENTVAHAQLTFGGGMLMLGSASNAATIQHWIGLEETGGRETVGLYLMVPDGECKATYDRAKAAGAEIVQELMKPDYGGEAFSCRDLEGHVWFIGTYNPWAEQAAPAAEGTA